MESKSWIKLFRKFKEWEWYGDINTSRLFLHLLLSANYEDKNWKGQIIPRGSLVTSRGKLAKETGLTVSQVRYTIHNLQVTNEVTSKTNNHFTLITINKYNDYQQINQQISRPLADQSPTSSRPVATTKEYKKEKNEKKYTDAGLTLDEVAEGIVKAFNFYLGTSFKSSDGIKSNLEYWLKTYTPKEMEKAIRNIKYDKFWNGKMTPVMLFRRRNPQGEPVDYIAQLLLVKQNYE